MILSSLALSTFFLVGFSPVANTDLKLDNTGKKIDKRARKYLNMSNLDYAHGTGHGVGFFLNVHEGPQSISKLNKVKIQEGMILSNEPGYYKKGSSIKLNNYSKIVFHQFRIHQFLFSHSFLALQIH